MVFTEPRERVVGALLGLAAGDALGVPVEFTTRKDRLADPVKEMRGRGTWNQPPGTWSDDTSLALCLAESIVLKGFDPEDFGQRALRWLDEGRWTARGAVFDVGGATRRALDRVRGGLPAVLAGGSGENDNGNGSLMRTAAASIWLAGQPDPLRLRAVAAWSAVTHGHPRSIFACWLHCLVSEALLAGEAPASAYGEAMAKARSLIPSLPPSFRAEAGAYDRVIGGALAGLPVSAIRGSGYVVHNLEAALWCLLNTADFASCVLAAVNLGEDCDTTGATAGSLAGLAYGRRAIPVEWRDCLARADEIEAMGESLAATTCSPRPWPGSYWVLPGKLLAGEYPRCVDGEASRVRLASLLESGVDALLDLTETGDGSPSDRSPGEFLEGRRILPYTGMLREIAAGKGIDVEVRNVPIRDMSAGDDALLHRALSDIDSMLDDGRCVFVHCLGGIGRTGAIVGSWLVERGLAAGGEVLGLLAALRSDTDSKGVPSPETEAQRTMLLSRKPGNRAAIFR